MQRQQEEQEIAFRKKQEEYSALEKTLGQILPLVSEANLSAEELKRDVTFTVRIAHSQRFLD